MWLTAHKSTLCPITTTTKAVMIFLFHRVWHVEYPPELTHKNLSTDIDGDVYKVKNDFTHQIEQ